ncbi:MAG: 50S ribosomal protein L23 [Candidatus Margulisbacteria bacterium]|nr:50S ribosomal protein L23 [Candidatus Margulisiibacteriota bacterium]
MDKQFVIKPVITEKSSLLGTENKYVFRVSSDLNKIEIRKAISDIFNVEVVAVNTINIKPRKKRLGRFTGTTRKWKKAVVTLKEGSKIENFEKLA